MTTLLKLALLLPLAWLIAPDGATAQVAAPAPSLQQPASVSPNARPTVHYDPQVQPASAAVPMPTANNPMPLRVTPKDGGPGLTRSTPNAMPSMVTMLASLAIVTGLFVIAAWLLRRTLPSGTRTLPPEVVEVLGRAPLAARQQAHLVRIGNKLLLLSISPTATETLTEITDPEEVDRLAGLCHATDTRSTTTTFRQMLQQFGRTSRPTDDLAADDAGEADHG